MSVSRFAASVLFACSLSLAGTPARAQQPGADLAALLQKLNSGGLVLAFSSPQPEAQPQAMDSDSDCTGDRALDPSAQAAAKALGDGFRNLELRFDGVFAGTGCRTRHTAFLAIGADWVRYRDPLSATCAGSAAPDLRSLTRQTPRAGHHHLLFTSACLLAADLRRAGVECMETPRPGDAVVYDPQADGAPLGCIRRQQWQAWAAQPHWSNRLAPEVSFPFRRFE